MSARKRTIIAPAGAQAMYDRYPFPQGTAVGVTQLASPEFLVEVRAVAVVGSALA